MAVINDKAALLGAAVRKQEVVQVDENTGVNIAEIPADVFFEIWHDKRFRFPGNEELINTRKMAPAIAAASISNEAGECLGITEEEFRNLPRNYQLLISVAAMRLNGVWGDEEKNSEASQEEDSSSGSLSS